MRNVCKQISGNGGKAYHDHLRFYNLSMLSLQAAIAEEALGERITPISSARLRTAAATALSAAAVKARVLADAEERECQRLVTAAIEAQFQKVQFKLQASIFVD